MRQWQTGRGLPIGTVCEKHLNTVFMMTGDYVTTADIELKLSDQKKVMKYSPNAGRDTTTHIKQSLERDTQWEVKKKQQKNNWRLREFRATFWWNLKLYEKSQSLYPITLRGVVFSQVFESKPLHNVQICLYNSCILCCVLSKCHHGFFWASEAFMICSTGN